MFRRIFTVSRHLRTLTTTVMTKVLNVAEKNDAAKNIAEILSRGNFRRKDGLSKYNKIYEFDYRLMNQQCKMLMTSVSGHLLDFDFIGAYRKWEAVNPVSLFEAPVEMGCLPDYQPIKSTLEREIRHCSMLIIWTDCDREGENIGFEIIDVCKKIKPNVRIFRAKFSEITTQSIIRACNNLVTPNQHISDAVNVRRELDLRIGAAFTRFQTLRFRRVFPNVAADIISYGSCQFPTLGFVVERYKQIQNFIPESFWKIRVLYRVEEDEVIFLWKRGKLFDHTACLVLYDICLENPLATVVNVQSKPKTKWRPLPLDTVELEKLASRKLRIGAKETMKIAESLYTKGFISYPRTETNIFPDSLDLVPIVEMQTQDQQWGEFAQQILLDRPNPRKGKKSDQAHPPIHPTKYTDTLQGNDKKLYEFIVRHFLACVSKDAEGFETIVEIDISKEKFTATGLMIIAKNFLEVYIYEKWNEKSIPVFTVGDKFHPSKIEMNESETEPPSLLTEADLIALMEKHGIGTDATHAEHIEKIKSRTYVGVRGDGRFLPAQLGMGLVEGYDSMGFEMSKPNLRAELEADLKAICDGLKEPKAVLQTQISKYKDVFIDAVAQVNKLDQSLAHYLEQQALEMEMPEIEAEDLKIVMPCPNCGSDMNLSKSSKSDQYYVGCMRFPNCRHAIWLPKFIQDIKVENELCELCHPRAVKKLTFTFSPRSMPPVYLSKHTGCLGGCSPDFSQDLGIHLPLNFIRSTPAQSNDSGYISSHCSTVDSASTRAPCRPVQQQHQRNAQRTLSIVHHAQENVVVCNCQQNAVQLTVRKEGPNQGRLFYKCAKQPHENPCNFFLFAATDDYSEFGNTWAHTNTRQPDPYHGYNSAPAFVGRQMTVKNQIQVQSSEDANTPRCTCGLPAKRLIVQKDGHNKGRPFFVCTKPQTTKCTFFQWADEDNADGVASSNGFSTTNNKRGTPGVKRKCSHCRQEGHNKRNCPTNGNS